MSRLTQLTTDIVTAHASTTAMTKDDLLLEIKEVFALLTVLDQREYSEVQKPDTEDVDPDAPAVTKRKAFGKDKIYCMVCGKGFVTLKRHLQKAHNMTPKEYCTKYDIPAGTTLAASNYINARRQMAVDKGLADNLAKARAAKKG